MAIKGHKSVVAPSDLVKELKALLERWREPGLYRVRPDLVVPDVSNRDHTGLSVDHIHFIATSMQRSGFRARPSPGDFSQKGNGKPHDIPVYVRGGPKCLIARRSLILMREMACREAGYPDVNIQEDGSLGWFCSLGSGHFTQALALFKHGNLSVFTGEPYIVPENDAALSDAVNIGVLSIVLREDTNIEDRRRISYLLNATHEYKWAVEANGEINISPEACYLERFSNFEAMAKNADSEALTELVRLELGYGMDEITGDRKKTHGQCTSSIESTDMLLEKHSKRTGSSMSKL